MAPREENRKERERERERESERERERESMHVVTAFSQEFIELGDRFAASRNLFLFL